MGRGTVATMGRGAAVGAGRADCVVRTGLVSGGTYGLGGTTGAPGVARGVRSGVAVGVTSAGECPFFGFGTGDGAGVGVTTPRLASPREA